MTCVGSKCCIKCTISPMILAKHKTWCVCMLSIIYTTFVNLIIHSIIFSNTCREFIYYLSFHSEKISLWWADRKRDQRITRPTSWVHRQWDVARGCKVQQFIEAKAELFWPAMMDHAWPHHCWLTSTSINSGNDTRFRYSSDYQFWRLSIMSWAKQVFFFCLF